MGTIQEVLFVTFAPRHFSARRRQEAAVSEMFRLVQYGAAADKVLEPITQRLLSGKYLKLFLNIAASRSAVIWVWGHDAGFVAALALLLRPETKLIWDISDVNRHLLGPGVKARVLRAMERMLARRADRVFLTSPWFFDQHFARFLPRNKVRIIENRRSASQAGQAVIPPHGLPLRIVFAGIFRSPAVLLCIKECAKRLGEQVVFEIYGYPDRNLDEGVLAALCEAGPNVRLHGRFDGASVHDIYRSAHLIWGFVDDTENANESWLLSNRIYDGIVTGRPVLTTAGTASGAYVARHRLGLALPLAPDAIVPALLALMQSGGDGYGALRAQMPAPATGYLDRDYGRAIEELLNE